MSKALGLQRIVNMKSFNYFIVLLFSLFITACSVRTGVLVEVSDGTEPLIGEAVASLASGVFEASNLDGFSCGGTYDQYSQSRMLKVNVKCNDGRTGEVIVSRTGPNLMNGSGIGKLSDGTKFRVLLGDMVHYRNAQGMWEKVK